jgi:hypothetical protein
MATTFKLLKNGKQQKKTNAQKNKNKNKNKTKNPKQNKAKQKEKEMKTHLTKNKVLQKSRVKASPVYTFISILTHVKEFKKNPTKTKQTNKQRKKNEYPIDKYTKTDSFN